MAHTEPVGIVWIAPEVVASARRAQTVKRHDGDADALIEKLEAVERDATGEYRRIRDFDNGDDSSLGSATRIEGGAAIEEHEDDLYVWIDDAPDNPDDGSGHFEVYDSAEHGEPYAPIPSRRGRPATEAPRGSEGAI